LEQAGERGTRLDLANWLVARENPLTARVAVNRFWQQVFGTGLVASSHDFGTQGALPTHPELLDWLAIWFQENGWDVKKLMRMMLTSATFRQRSEAEAKIWEADPGNVHLARGPRFRLAAEQLRDQALFTGGLLRMDMGGKGVNPYQPPNIWEPVGFGGSNTRFYQQSENDGLYRRTLYTFFKRTAPHPMMTNFDAPNREQSCIKRDLSNTPLQALQLMNDIQHYEAARGLAQRMMMSSTEVAARITFAYRTVLSRPPAEEEMAVVMELYQRQMRKYEAMPEEAKKAAHRNEESIDRLPFYFFLLLPADDGKVPSLARKRGETCLITSRVFAIIVLPWRGSPSPRIILIEYNITLVRVTLITIQPAWGMSQPT
jgi:hypothetical protein